MNSISNVIDQITNILKDRPAGISPEVVAEQYQAACESANARLARIDVMLANNSDIEALQVAEESPSLMGQVELLSFGDEVAWQEYCVAHGHAVAPLIDFRKVEALAALYQKGLSPNHPLYRDYRAAIRSREDDRALELLGIISRLNPSDANALKEMHRLGRKGTIAELERLKVSLQSGTDEELVAVMAKVDAIAPDEEHRSRPEWKTALARRGAYEKREAHKRMTNLLEKAVASLAPDLWRTAANYEAEITRLGSEYGFPAEDAYPERLETVTKALSGYREEAAKEAEIHKIVRKLESLAEEVETRGVTPEGITVVYATSSLDTMRRQERELARLGAGVPGSSRARIHATGDRLEQIVNQARTRKRITHGTVAAFAAILLFASAGFGFVALQASSYKNELVDAISSGSVQRTKSLVSTVDRSGLIFRFPTVVSKVAEAEQWVTNRADEAAVAEKLLAELEAGASSGFTEMEDAVALHSKLETCGELVSEVAGDLRPPLESRYAVARNEGESRLLALQQNSAKKAMEIAEKCENFAENVDYKGYAGEAGRQLEELLADIRNLEPLLVQEDPLLRLPVNVASAIKAARTRIEDIHGKIKAVEEAYRGLTNADDLEDYGEKLAILAETQFADAGMARAIGEAIPITEKLKANLLTGGDLSKYKLAVTVAAAGNWTPKLAGDLDRDWVKALRSHPCYADIYRIKHPTLNGYSRGEPVKQVNESTNLISWEMDYTPIPNRRSETVSYETKNIKMTDSSNFTAKLTETSALMKDLNLYGFLDSTGSRFKRPAVELVDTIFAAKSCPALAKAYLLREVFGLIDRSQAEWGTFLSASLLKDIEEYDALTSKGLIMPVEWMMENNGDNAKVWEEYFATRKPGSRADEIVRNGKIVASTARAATVLCGHVNQTGEIELRGEIRKGIVMGFTVSTPDKKVRLCVAGTLDGEDFKPALELAKSSPLILLDLDVQAVEFLLSKEPVGRKFD
jgi:hypothetical protein